MTTELDPDTRLDDRLCALAAHLDTEWMHREGDIIVPLEPVRMTRRRAVVGAAAVMIALGGVGTLTLLDDEPQAPVNGAGGDVTSGLLVLDLDGRPPTYVTDDGAGTGELQYDRDSDEVALQWRPAAAHQEWLDDRLCCGNERLADAAVADVTAVVVRYTDSQAFTALWVYGDRSYELRDDESDPAEFAELLDHVVAVDDAAFAAHIDAVATTGDERPAAVAAMLVGIPVPPGFEAAPIATAGTTDTDHQLRAAVVSAVLCGWVDELVAADVAGDAARREAAFVAIESAPAWPILEPMRAVGGYPSVVEGLAPRVREWNGVAPVTDTALPIDAANILEQFTGSFGCRS